MNDADLKGNELSRDDVYDRFTEAVAAALGESGPVTAVHEMEYSAKFLHHQFPPSRTDEFHDLTADGKVLKYEIPQMRIVLIRDLSKPFNTFMSACQECAWSHLICYAGGSNFDDGEDREMPCEGNRAGRHPFRAYDLTVMAKELPGEKGYIPDRPEDFDIAGTWNSIRTMIGMG